MTVTMKSIIFWDVMRQVLLAACLLSLLFDPEKGGNMFLRNIRKYLIDYMMAHPRRQYSSVRRILMLSCWLNYGRIPEKYNE
jgi:hypothetical protein